MTPKATGPCPPRIWRYARNYVWRSRARLELPPPADSNVIAFDPTSEHLLPIATIIREATPEHQTALIKHIVERVTMTDGEVTDIELRPEARPFYAGLAMAPPDGLWGARPTFVVEGVSELVMELLAA